MFNPLGVDIFNNVNNGNSMNYGNNGNNMSYRNSFSNVQNNNGPQYMNNNNNPPSFPPSQENNAFQLRAPSPGFQPPQPHNLSSGRHSRLGSQKSLDFGRGIASMRAAPQTQPHVVNRFSSSFHNNMDAVSPNSGEGSGSRFKNLGRINEEYQLNEPTMIWGHSNQSNQFQQPTPSNQPVFSPRVAGQGRQEGLKVIQTGYPSKNPNEVTWGDSKQKNITNYSSMKNLQMPNQFDSGSDHRRNASPRQVSFAQRYEYPIADLEVQAEQKITQERYHKTKNDLISTIIDQQIALKELSNKKRIYNSQQNNQMTQKERQKYERAKKDITEKLQSNKPMNPLPDSFYQSSPSMSAFQPWSQALSTNPSPSQPSQQALQSLQTSISQQKSRLRYLQAKRQEALTSTEDIKPLISSIKELRNKLKQSNYDSQNLKTSMIASKEKELREEAEIETMRAALNSEWVYRDQECQQLGDKIKMLLKRLEGADKQNGGAPSAYNLQSAANVGASGDDHRGAGFSSYFQRGTV